MGVELSHRRLKIFSIEFHKAFVVETWLVGFALQRVMSRKVFDEWQQRRQNKSAMSEVVGVVGLKCEEV